MSFSGDIKEELSERTSTARHCRLAELAAIISMCGHISEPAGMGFLLRVTTENIAVAEKFHLLLKKTFGIFAEIAIRRSAYLRKVKTYTIIVNRHDEAKKILSAVKMIKGDIISPENILMPDNALIMSQCCKMAFIRGAFLVSGSISDPNKSYHFEIVTEYRGQADRLRDIIQIFQIDVKIVERKKHYVVYIKEGSGIVDILGVMGAHLSLMAMENIRIIKEMRNSVNRKVNCETANICKTVAAACRQINDIEYIRDNYGLERLPEQLCELAVMRLRKPEASLIELGTSLNKPIGKSGVNHRLRKLSEFAADLKEEKHDIQ